jgi:hypothetical protein
MRRLFGKIREINPALKRFSIASIIVPFTVGPTFSPRLETLFNEGTGSLDESEVRILQLWKFVNKGFKPWEIEPDYEDNERIIKLEDKADILKLDQFAFNAQQNKQKKKAGLDELIKKQGLSAGQQVAKGLPKSW